MKDWIENVWQKKSVTLFCPNLLLVLDNFQAYINEEKLRKVYKKFGLMTVIPGGLTSVLQLLDVLINKPFTNGIQIFYM